MLCAFGVLLLLLLPRGFRVPKAFACLYDAVGHVARLQQRRHVAGGSRRVAHDDIVGLRSVGVGAVVALAGAHGDCAVVLAGAADGRSGGGGGGGAIVAVLVGASASSPAARGLLGAGAVHQEILSLAELVDGADGVDGGVQGAAGVEVLLDGGQQVLAGAVRGREAGDEGVLQGLVGGDALVLVNGEAAPDKVLCGRGDAAPVLDRGEAVVGVEDGLHLLEVGVAVEGGVAAEQEVGDDANGPEVDGLAVARLLEDLGGHVAGGAAGGGEHVELLLVHDAREAKVGNEQVGVVLGRAEEQVLGLEVAVDDAVVVQVGDGRERRADEVGGVGFVVGALAADAVEELAAEGQVRDEVEVVHRLEVVDQRQDVLVAHGDLFEDGDFIADLRSRDHRRLAILSGFCLLKDAPAERNRIKDAQGKCRRDCHTMCSRPAIRRLLITLAA